jgi:hypothetical protein
MDDRRRSPVLAQRRFAERRGEFDGLDLADRFALIHRTNLWGADNSASGVGSELTATATLRHDLAALLRAYDVHDLLDLPCGDFTWMAHMDLGGIRYLGADIVPALIEANTAKHARADRISFRRLNLVEDSLPAADLILCRDCLVHLSFAHLRRALDNIRRSGSRWLLTTTFLELESNRDIEDGDWRALNLQRAPFFFPEPEAVIVEGCDEAGGEYADKALALWPVARLPDLTL